jgi:hypothetical protein
MRPAVPWNLGTSTTRGRRITIQQNARCPEVCESHPHTSGLIRPGNGSQARDGGGLGLGGCHPSRLSMNIHPHSPLQGESTGGFTGLSTDFFMPTGTKKSRIWTFWSQFRPGRADGRLPGLFSGQNGRLAKRTCPALPLPTGSQSYPRRANVIQRGIGVIHGASRLLTRNPGCLRRRNLIHGKAELSGAIHGCFGVDNATGSVNNLETPWIALLRGEQPGVGMDRVALAWITLPCDE